MSPDNTTVETQVNESPDVTVNTEDTTVEAEPTVADLHQDVTPEKKKATEVPIARLNKEIEKRKALENELAELKRVLDGDDSVEDVEEESEVKKLAQEISQIKERESKTKLEASFQENLNKALDKAPEYKGIVNVEVMRTLVFNPENANKTYPQLLEEAYGNALTGRRTIETTTPRGGAKDTQLDRRRAETDVEYRREVLADPALRKQYNEGLTDRVFR